MKKLILLSAALLFSTISFCQTKVFDADKAGKKNLEKSYMLFEEGSGKVYKIKPDGKKERMPDLIIKIKGTEIIYVYESTEKEVVLGYFEKGKIYRFKSNEKRETGETVKDKIVYEGDKIEGHIEGKAIYGAVAYLLGLFQ